MTFESLVQQVRAKLEHHNRATSNPFVIAIDGPSGAGKSTLAAALSEVLAAPIVCGDDFFMGDTGISNLSPALLADSCIDRARLATVLMP